MKNNIRKRVLEEADIIINTHISLRELAKLIGVSKSTIHNDMKYRLETINEEKYRKVKQVFSKHIDERHFLGGLATRKKYKKVTIK